MRSPADLTAWSRRKYASGVRGWLAGGTAEPVSLGYPTEPPSEALVAGDPASATEWVQAWTTFERSAPPAVTLQWVVRRWRGFGDQRLPVRVVVESAAAMASLAGRTREWQALNDRADLLRASWPGATELDAAVGRGLARLAGLSAEDMPRLVATVNWFLAHPSSGLLPRQVAVEGVDTKWLERHTAIVRNFVEALTGSADLGLRTEPRRFRVRTFGDGPLTDFNAAAAELAALDLNPDIVLLVENRDSMTPLQGPAGLVAVHAQGLAAPELAVVPWIARSRVLYWGDLDTHGLRILGLVRQVLAQTESVLMNRATLGRFARLTVTEPAPFRGGIGHLTAEESAVLRVLREHDHRLEQERIPWAHVVDALRERIS